MKNSITLLILLASFALSVTFGCNRPEASRTYTVGLLLIPARLDPWHNQVNTNHFIDLQIYYPLFSKSKGRADLTSDFLNMASTRALNSKLDLFQFCLRPGVRFSDKSEITLDDLRYTLNEAHRTQEVLPTLKSLLENDGCLIASLGGSDAFYFDKLAGVSSTLLKKSTINNPAPVGLGPYKVAAIQTDEIHLIATENSSKSLFQKVIFKQVKDSVDGRRLGLIDLNHVYSGSSAPLDAIGYTKISTPVLKTYSLVVSVPESKLRHAFAECLDRKAFTSQTGIPLDEVPGFLPRGILGADVSFESLLLSKRKRCRWDGDKPTLKFYNHIPDKQTAFEKYFREQDDSLPFHVVVELHSLAETAQALYGGKTLLAVCGFDSSGSQAAQFGEAAVYFESFFRKERLIRDPIPEVEKLVKGGIDGGTPEIKASFYKRAHQTLLASGFVVPLGQYRAEQYYPKWISNVVWADQLSGFPQIDRMRRGD